MAKKSSKPSKGEAEKQGSPSQQGGPRNVDYRKVGPTSIEGVEASDLPDKGRGPIETSPSHAATRLTPKTTGGTIGGPSGMHARGDIREADARTDELRRGRKSGRRGG